MTCIIRKIEKKYICSNNKNIAEAQNIDVPEFDSS